MKRRKRGATRQLALFPESHKTPKATITAHAHRGLAIVRQPQALVLTRKHQSLVVTRKPKALVVTEQPQAHRVIHTKGSRYMPHKGQFKKGGGRHGSHHKAHHTTHHKKVHHRRHHAGSALTVVENVKPVVKVIRVGAAPHKTRHPAPRHNHTISEGRREGIVLEAHGVGEFVPSEFRAIAMATASAIGIADSKKSLTFITDLFDKLPKLGNIPAEILVGLAANYFADGEGLRRHLDPIAQGLLDTGAYKAGLMGLEKVFKFSGDDDNW